MARIAHVVLLGLVCFPCIALAQTGQTLFSQSDLDQILAPVALYPDDLISNLLTAATYPLEVVQADRYIKQNSGLQGNALADMLNTQPWDPSVKALAQFPSVLAMMDDELSWTEELGDAFLAQPADVMDTVQSLRAKAIADGNLQSNTEQTVQSQGNDISIQPAAPDVVYVPYYDPSIVYGTWWWPTQLPIFWSPPPLYRPYNFGNIGSGGIAYGGRVTVNGSGFSRFQPNWGSHTIAVGAPHRAYSAWQHDPAHRQGVAYRSVPSVNRALQQATPPRPQYTMRAAQPEYRPAAPVPPMSQQHVEAPQYQQYPAAPAESHPAPAQHAEANHNNNNSDLHKLN